MLGEVLNILCNKSDRYNEAGNAEAVKYIRECISVIHEVYKQFDWNKNEVFSTDSDLDNALIGTGRVKLYIKDGKKSYEIYSEPDSTVHHLLKRYDRPEEVLDFYIKQYDKFRKVQEKLRKERQGKKMNKVLLSGIITKDPDVRSTGNSMVASYTLAVKRRFVKDDNVDADFIRCVCFGKAAEFIQKYCHKGTRLNICGRIQTGQYKDKDGRTVYTTDVIVEEQEFGESKASSESRVISTAPVESNKADSDGFVSFDDNLSDEGLPWN